MNKEKEILSDIIVHMKYARYLDKKKRRETYKEIVDRNLNMHLEKFKGLKDELKDVYQYVYDKKVLPSMRSMQFAGKPIRISPNRIYNCCYLPIDDWRAFQEIMFLLLGGTGVGYSVQKHHVEQLPEIVRPTKERRYLVGDSIEGWADAVGMLVKSYYINKTKPKFDFSDIRSKGERLITSGGKAPGPQPLKDCLHNIEKIFDQKENGEKLTTLEVHDIVCYIADAVLAGGIRRAALISLFSFDDVSMRTCKFGNWWEQNPQRGRANNSALVLRHRITEKGFKDLWEKVEASGSGEPGILFSNNQEYGTNPCKPLDSKILTPNGYITFREALEKDKLNIITPDGNISPASKPFKTGENREVYEVLLSNGLKLLGTNNHKHMNKDGQWVELKDLKIGDKLKVGHTKHYSLNVDNQNDYNKGLLHGWMLGDGWNFKRSDTDNSKRAGLCFGSQEFDVIPLYEKLTGTKSKPHHQKSKTCRTLYVHQDNFDFTDKWKLPFTKSKDYKLGFIKSLFTADGSVRKNNNVELYSINREMLEGVCLLLQEFGIRSTVCVHNYSKKYTASDGKKRNNKTTHKLNVYAGQYKRIGFLSKEKNSLLQNQNDKGLYRRKNYETIVDISLRSIEDVYDITVYNNEHSFIDTGIVTHNCAEISLKPFQFCNLTEINGANIESKEDFMERVKVATILGTLQASYTDFHYLRDVWKRTTEKDALIGVGITGIASNTIDRGWLKEGSDYAKEVNEEWSEKLGINKAARVTTVKPSGTSSLVLGCSSGIHAWHDDYYIRRLRVGKNEAIYSYLKINHPELIEDEYFKPDQQAVISVPQKAPEGADTREESVFELLERVKAYNLDWVRNGHRSGDNTNNVSATISIKDDEWERVGKWMWDNRYSFNGLSVLPFDGGSYTQAPFETIDKETFNEMFDKLGRVDLTQIVELQDETDLKGEAACAGGACEIV